MPPGPARVECRRDAGRDEGQCDERSAAHAREQEIGAVEQAHGDAQAGHQPQQLFMQQGRLGIRHRRSREGGLPGKRRGFQHDEDSNPLPQRQGDGKRNEGPV